MLIVFDPADAEEQLTAAEYPLLCEVWEPCAVLVTEVTLKGETLVLQSLGVAVTCAWKQFEELPRCAAGSSCAAGSLSVLLQQDTSPSEACGFWLPL